MKNLRIKLSISFLFVSCFLFNFFSYSQQVFDKINNGIVVHVHSGIPGIAKTIRLQVVNDNIIRVTSTPADNLSNDTSLIIVYKDNSTSQFTTEQNGDT